MASDQRWITRRWLGRLGKTALIQKVYGTLVGSRPSLPPLPLPFSPSQIDVTPFERRCFSIQGKREENGKRRGCDPPAPTERGIYIPARNPPCESPAVGRWPPGADDEVVGDKENKCETLLSPLSLSLSTYILLSTLVRKLTSFFAVKF